MQDKSKHEHDEKCVCGCQHEHEHEHGHEHHHEHEHEHDHNHEHEHHTNGEISVYMHDISTVGSLSFEISVDKDAATDMLKDILLQLADKLEESGGTIGHIKAIIRSNSDVTMISVTEPNRCDLKHARDVSLHIDCAAIVFGVTQEDLKEQLTEVFGKLLV